MHVPDIARLIETLATRAADAAIARSRIVHAPLREALRDMLRRPAGQAGSFLADPLFEAMFGWRNAGQSMQQLADSGLLHPALVSALARDVPINPEERVQRNTFPRQRTPYQHQLQAWQALREDPPRPLVVTSGTGSGKTECFLVPILDDMVRERDRHGRLLGVQALFLYPLNALIASQRDRLADWCEPFGGDIRFCLYNGNTPEQVQRAEAQRTPWEVLDRQSLRSAPPPILVTNATMLEYMLVRSADQPILAQSRGRLRWIVLDEAHTYIGSQAAEMALLLRRTLHAFGVQPSQVRFIATSATLGNADSARHGLREFLARLSGHDGDSVRLVAGEQQVPELVAGEHPGLADDPLACGIRSRLAGGATPRSEIASLCNGQDVSALLTRAARSLGSGGISFLPLRVHLFHRAQPGVWACINPGCSGKRDTRLTGGGWPFGCVMLRDTPHCPHCNSLLLQLAVCDDCGAPFLEAAADRAETRLTHWREERLLDEFAAEAEADDPDEDAPEPEADSRILLARPGLKDGALLAVDPRTGTIGDTMREGLIGIGRHEPIAGCPCCGAGNNARRRLFRPLRLGGPFMVGNASTVLLDAAPPRPEPALCPDGGRQMLSFTDNRQGTARLAATWQQDAERNYARSVLLHAVSAGDPEQSAQIEDKRRQIATLQEHGSIPAVQDVVTRLKAELERLGAGGLSWSEARRQLAMRNAEQIGLRELWAERDPAFRDTDWLANLQLHAELLRRPTRGNNLETMGLIELRFDGIEKQRDVPELFAEHGGTPEDWRDFLSIAATHLVRARRATGVVDSLRNWIGQRAFPRSFVEPESDSPLNPTELRWPRISGPDFQRSRLVRMLAQGLNLDLSDTRTRNLANEALQEAFRVLRSAAGSQAMQPNLQLDLSRARLVRVETVFACPVTLRLLDRSFRGVTPYVPMVADRRNLACKRLTMPPLPYPWLRDAQASDRRRDTAAWLEQNEAVEELRREGAWTDLHDRLVLLSPFARIVEHSAQQPGRRLRDYEQAFAAGRINVLACSTTMEMGVDIGGVTTVAMTNVPPSAANYRQRVGRAGRRREPVAVAFTYCADDPLGWSVFDDPKTLLEQEIRPPRVALESRPIVRRHVNAFLLGQFLAAPDCPITHDRTRLPAVWFFGAVGQDHPSADVFVAWLTSRRDDPELNRALKSLTAGSALAGSPDLMERCAEAVRTLATNWRAERDAVAEDLQAAQEPVRRAIQVQLQRIENEFLLSELTRSGFLPGHGFPTGIVPFVALSPAEMGAGSLHRREREDTAGGRSRDFPTRGVETAIREYAPGNDVVLDGLVYRSAGVTLNWQRPASDHDVQEIQSIRWFWRCGCGAAGTALRLPVQCPSCGKADPTREHVLEPAGFSADLAERPGADVENLSYVPAIRPMVSVPDADWVALENPQTGRIRATANGLVLGLSRGPAEHGYAICLRCGRAEPEHDTAANSPSPLGSHPRLRRGRGQLRCDAQPGSFAIQRNLRLGYSRTTDVCEVQLAGITDETLACTVVVALREALARELGIERDELGWAAEQRQGADGRQCWSLLLFDTAAGGAGYASAATRAFPSLVRTSRQVLNCSNRDCDRACPACLITRDTLREAENLDRRLAQDVLEKLESMLVLPAELRVFDAAPEQWMCAQPLAQAVGEILQVPGMERLVLHLGGEPVDWDLENWWGIALLDRYARQGVSTTLVLSKRQADTLRFDDLLSLHALVERAAPHVTVATIPGAPEPSNLLAVAVASGRARGWAAAGKDPLVGAAPPGAVVYAPSMTWAEPASSFDVGGALARLRPSILRITVRTELDGRIGDFGNRFWSLVQRQNADVRDWLTRQTAAEVEYEDRYLFSPLSVALLTAVLHSLPRPANTRPRLNIRTQAERPGGSGFAQPTSMFHDWRNTASRDRVLKMATAEAGYSVTLETGQRHQLPHARCLRIVSADGERLEIMLDQGFGYWRSRGGNFDFTAAATDQAKAVLRGDVMVTGSAQCPTTFVLEWSPCNG